MFIPSPRREQSQKGEEMNREGRKELGEKRVYIIREETRFVNSLAHSRCSINAHFLAGETRQIRKKGKETGWKGQESKKSIRCRDSVWKLPGKH